MKPTLVICVVGLSPRHLRDAPALRALGESGSCCPLDPVLPAVTCTVQSSLLTGLRPSETGVVGNGWYFRDTSEVRFWLQSNALVHGETIWEAAAARNPDLRCAQLFWWYNMYSTAQLSVTPRPAYPADGRKIPDIYSEPPELRARLNAKLGSFPLFNFWGPKADIRSSRWITDCAIDVIERDAPELGFVYLPHLDYCLQRQGPGGADIPREVASIDREAGRLIDAARARGYQVIALSEYGITEVRGAVAPNRALREAGFLRTQTILDSWELLDCGASRAFAVADHQVAHIYVKDPRDIAPVKTLLERLDGVDRVYAGPDRASIGLDHPRAGELVAFSSEDRWFSYYYWLDEARAPDFARCVDIHRKPGFDPVELFFDPQKPGIAARAAWKLAKKKLGFRGLMDLIPLDSSLVKGSHGRAPSTDEDGPVFLSSSAELGADRMSCLDVKDAVLRLLFSGR